jgi:hypothetical protein
MLAGASEQVRESLASQVRTHDDSAGPAEFANLALAIIENPMINGAVIRLDGAIRTAPR